MSRDARERRKGDAPTDATRSENDRRCRRMSWSTRRRRFLVFLGEHAQLHAGRDGGKGKERFLRRFTRYQFRHLFRENTCKSCPCSTSHGSRRRRGASRQLRRGSCKNTAISFHLFKWSSKSQHQRLETPPGTFPRARLRRRGTRFRDGDALHVRRIHARGDLRDPGPRVGFRTGGPRGDCRARGARA